MKSDLSFRSSTVIIPHSHSEAAGFPLVYNINRMIPLHMPSCCMQFYHRLTPQEDRVQKMRKERSAKSLITCNAGHGCEKHSPSTTRSSLWKVFLLLLIHTTKRSVNLPLHKNPAAKYERYLRMCFYSLGFSWLLQYV